MSGTSLDGLDLAYCKFHQQGIEWSWEILKAVTIPYSASWKSHFLHLPAADKDTISIADIKLGEYIGKAVRAFIEKYNLKVDFIASHGHTIFHDPSNRITLQIGEGGKIAEISGLKVINDFRSKDISMGGQGAPLVPLGDRLLFPEYDYCLNLGGIANISFERADQRIAFDICPVNIVLNMLAEKTGIPFDDKGKLAARGTILPLLLKKLESLSFYSLQGPRSLGREWVEENITPIMALGQIPDLMSTFTEHIALRISSVAKGKGTNMLVTGGGALNTYLMERIKAKCETDIVVPEKSLIDYKEAMIFAFLGLLRLEGINNILGSVTGSGQDHCAGTIYYPSDQDRNE